MGLRRKKFRASHGLGACIRGPRNNCTYLAPLKLFGPLGMAGMPGPGWNQKKELLFRLGPPTNLDVIARNKHLPVDVFVPASLVSLRCKYFQITTRRYSKTWIDCRACEIDDRESGLRSSGNEFQTRLKLVPILQFDLFTAPA
jgi:hypothetical protein